MNRRTQKSNKRTVATRATPDQQIVSRPPPESLKSLSTARAVLAERHAGLKSWSVLSWELGGVDRGTLSRVAAGIREPSIGLINKINNTYGCHVHAKTARLTVTVCPICGEIPTAHHKCKAVLPKPRRVYDLSTKRARAIGISIYIAI